MSLYTRKEAAEKTGISSDTLRYYEKLGVIPAPERADNSYRMYSDDDIVRLLFIKQAKTCGFSLKEIAHTIAIVEGSEDCDTDSDTIIDAKIAQIDLQVEELYKMKAMLLQYKGQMREIKSCYLSRYLLEKK